MSESFSKLFEACAAVETDLEILEMSETFKELVKDYEPKNENLFKLNFQVSPKLRFRVLKDMDPRILRVGVETNCCQRISGVAESAAKDSFVNPLAGVVVLEQDSGGQWALLAQSYFHYVPGDPADGGAGGFILDNVEINRDNVQKSGISLEPLYAYLAAYLKDKFEVEFMLSGKGYSKIDTRKFSDRTGMLSDPRSFSPKATTYHNRVYTDFSPNNAMNLLEPQFDLDEELTKTIGDHQKFEKKSQNTEKKAFERILRKIILTSYSL